MLILNAGCGGMRPGYPFINLDCLRSVLAIGTPERTNLDAEDNYVDADITKPLPFPDNHFDAACSVHVVEHLTCHEAAVFLSECGRVTKPGGLVIASVPDSDYFLSVYDRDTKELAEELFGEPIHDAGHEKFFTYALWRYDHIQLLTASSLRCIFLKAGFTTIIHWNYWPIEDPPSEALLEINKLMSRRKFSVEMCGIKT